MLSYDKAIEKCSSDMDFLNEIQTKSAKEWNEYKETRKQKLKIRSIIENVLERFSATDMSKLIFCLSVSLAQSQAETSHYKDLLEEVCKEQIKKEAA